jgi:hypothetical protein
VRQAVTTDIQEHPVITQGSVSSARVSTSIPQASNIGVTQYQRSTRLPQTVSVSAQPVGQATFDPDPVTQVSYVQPPPERRTVIGPYGPGGQEVQVTGVYKPPVVREAVTTDIQEHPVITQGNVSASNVVTQPQRLPQSVSVSAQPVGQATFDPDPVTQVSYVQPAAERRTVVGPYGPGGQQIQVTGVYKPPVVRQAVTTDIQEHPVVVAQP